MTRPTTKASYGCTLEATLDIIGGKWKSVVLHHLLGGVKRFNELRRLMPGVTQRMLTLQLRELEQDGLIERRVYAEVPPRVEYRLTADGESLRPIIELMCVWGATYVDTVLERRAAAAEREQEPVAP